jgi:hypothetical protein
MTASTSDLEDKNNNIEALWRLPFDLVLEVAAFSAGAFQFKTFLNLSLCCHEVHESLKPVLKAPIVQWDAAALQEWKIMRQPYHESFPSPSVTIWSKAQ